MRVFSRRAFVIGLLAAGLAAAPVGRAEDGFTPVKSSVRYRKIGVYDRARLTAILESDLDAFLTGSTMKRGEFTGVFAAPRTPSRSTKCSSIL